ncbi:MAG TPA: ABC transporter permease [Limnochordales bacterium]
MGASGWLADGRAVLAVFKKQWMIQLRYPAELLGLVVWPVLFPAIYIFSARALAGPEGEAVAVFASRTGTEDYVGYILFGTMLWMILNMTLWDLGGHLRREQLRGTLEVCWTTPASRVGMLMGVSLAQISNAVLFLAVAALMLRLVYGFELRGSVGLLLVLMVLSILPVIGLGLAFASLVLVLKEINSLVFLVRGVFMVFAGMTYPVEVLPGWMQAVSAFLPLTYSIRAMRAVGLSGAGWADVQGDALALAMFSVVFLVAGWRAFRAVERMAQQAGTLTHY